MYISRLFLCQQRRAIQIVYVYKSLSKCLLPRCGVVLFSSTSHLYTQDTSNKSSVKRMPWNAATSNQPIAMLANQVPVAAHKVAAQTEREWLFLLITGGLRCASTDVVVSCAGVASKATVYGTHVPCVLPSSRCRQPNYPLSDTSVVGLQDNCLGTACRCCCKRMLLLLLTVLCRTYVYRRKLFV